MNRKPVAKVKYKIRYRDAMGRFVKAPKKSKGKLPEGITKSRIKYVLISKLSDGEKKQRQRVKERAQLAKKITKGVPKDDISKIQLNKERHIRYRTEKSKQWKKVGSKGFSKPKKGVKYQTAIFEGNTMISFWKNTEYKIWDEYYNELVLKDAETVRFPQSKRWSFPLDGETLRESIEKFSVDGLCYQSELHYEMRFSGKTTSGFGTKETIKFYHRGFMSFDHMYGKSYDEYFQEQLIKAIDAVLKDTGRRGNKGVAYRFTSNEKLMIIAENPGWAEDEDWFAITEEKMENELHLTDIHGSFVGMVK
jgi:hypothetical protein